MHLEIENKVFDISIVNVHASWKILRINKKIFFYGKIQNEFAKIPRHDVKIVIDNFNAKIRKKKCTFIPTIGKFRLHDLCSENLIRVVNFTASNNIIISRLCFEYKSMYKKLWFLLVKRQKTHWPYNDRWKNANVIDVWSHRDTDLDSDHFLIIMKYKQRVTR